MNNCTCGHPPEYHFPFVCRRDLIHPSAWYIYEYLFVSPDMVKSQYLDPMIICNPPFIENSSVIDLADKV